MAQVGAVAGYTIARRAAVESAVIIEMVSAIEDEKLRRANGMERASHLLRVIVEDGKGKALLGGHFGEVGRGVVRISHSVVGTDAGESNLSGQVMAGKANDFGQDMAHVGAMAAEENYDQSLRAGERCGGDRSAGDNIGQGEIRDGHPRRERFTEGKSHERNFTAGTQKSNPQCGGVGVSD